MPHTVKTVALIPVISNTFYENFVGPEVVPSQEVPLVGKLFLRRPLKTGRNISLLGVTTTHEAIKIGIMSIKDKIQPGLAIERLYLRVGNHTVIIGLTNPIQLLEEKGQPGHRLLHVDKAGSAKLDFGFGSQSVDCMGLPIFKDEFGKNLSVMFEFNGELSAEFSHINSEIHVWVNKLKMTTPLDGLKLLNVSEQTLYDLSTVTVVGFDVAGERGGIAGF